MSALKASNLAAVAQVKDAEDAASSACDAQFYAHTEELRRLKAELAAQQEQSIVALKQQQAALTQVQCEGAAEIARLSAELTDAHLQRQQSELLWKERMRQEIDDNLCIFVDKDRLCCDLRRSLQEQDDSHKQIMRLIQGMPTEFRLLCVY